MKNKIPVLFVTLLILLLTPIFFVSILVSAPDTGTSDLTTTQSKVTTAQMSNYVKEDFNSKYGVITLTNKFSDKIAEYSLTKNTEYCIINCEAEGRVTLYSDGVLFDEVKFITLKGADTSIKSSEYLLFDGYTDNFVIVPDTYKDVCVIDNTNATGIKICNQEVNTTKLVNQPIENWIKYDGSVLRAGDYRWKIKGVKDKSQSVDFIPIREKAEFTEWATWTSGMNVGLVAYYDFETLDSSKLVDRVGLHNGSVNSTITLIANGKNGNAYLQDGNNGNDIAAVHINTNENDLLGNTEGSYSFWLNVSVYNTDDYLEYMVTTQNTWGNFFADVNDTAIGWHNAWGRTLLAAHTGELGNHLNTNFYIPGSYFIGTYHHVVFTWNASDRRFYIDGIKNVSDANVNSMKSGNDGDHFLLFVKAETDPKWAMDELGVWNRTLTPQEVADISTGIYYTNSFDTIAPNITILYPANNTNSSNNMLTINYTVLDETAISTCWYSNDTYAVNTTLAGCINITTVTWAEGQHNVTVWVNDSAGNKNSSFVRFTIDTIKPNINITYPENKTYGVNVSTFNYTITDINPDSCWYSLDKGVTNSSPQVCGTNWSGLISVEGSNNWTVYANDSANNTNSTMVVFYKNTLFDTITLLLPTTANYTNFTTLNFTATLSDSSGISNSTFYLWNGAGIYNSTFMNIGGVLTSFEIGTKIYGIPEGNYNWSYDAYDTFSNYKLADNFTLTIDTTYPVIDFDTQTNASGINRSATTIYVNVTFTEANFNYINFTLFNSTGFYNASNSSTSIKEHTFTQVPEGNYWYNVTLCDKAGQCATTGTRKILLDVTAPTAEQGYTGGTGGDGYVKGINNTYSSNTTINFTGNITDIYGIENISFNITNSSGQQVNYTIWTGLGGALTKFAGITLTLLDGFYDWIVSAWDTSSNFVTSTWMRLTVDTTPAAITITYPTNTTLWNNVSALNYTIVEANNDSCWYSKDNGVINSTFVTAGTNWTGVVSAEGSNTWYVYCNDSAGNLGSSSRTFVKDTVNVTLLPLSNIPITTTIDFNCSANLTGGSNLANISLWTNSTGTWVRNQTLNISTEGLCYQEYANVSTSCGGLATGLYNLTGIWDGSTGFEVFDGDWSTLTKANTGTTATLYTNYTVPVGAINSSKWEAKLTGTTASATNYTIPKECWKNPLEFKIISSEPATNYVNASCYNGTSWHNVINFTDTTANNLQIYEEAMIWNITNVTNITHTFQVPYMFQIPLLFHTLWNCEACGLDDVCGFAGENKSTDFKVFVNNINYTNITTSGSSDPFTINFTYNPSYAGIAVLLQYNNTNYTMLTNDTGNTRTYTYNPNAPVVSSSENKTFNFIFVLSNSSGTYYLNTDYASQTINPFVINSTCNGMYTIFNFTIKDEIHPSIALNGAGNITSMKIDLNVYTTDRTILIKQYSNIFNNTNPVGVCINNDLSNGGKYSVDAQVQYSAANYSSEFYNIERYILNSSSLNKNISLYDLDTDNAQKFKIIAKDSSYLPISNALIQIERKYIENGTYYITEIPKTNSEGITSASLQLNDVIYNFYIYQDGILVSSFTNVIAICQTPAISNCEINLNTFQEGMIIPDYETGDDFNFTIDYNKTSKVVSSQFVIPSGNPAVVKLEVIKDDSLGTAVCENTLTSASGTLSCTVPNSFGNSTVRARLYRNNIEQGYGSIKLDQTPSDIFGVILIMISVFVMMTLIGLAVSDNPVITGVFLFIGVVLMFAINLIGNSGFIGATATILFLAIAIIIVLIKAARRS